MIHGAMKCSATAAIGLTFLSAACAPARGVQPTYAHSGDTRSVVLLSGLLRVSGDVQEGGPCATLAPLLDRELEGGLKVCKYVALEFSPTKRKSKQTVYDLWLVSGPTHETDAKDEPVVDFYEEVTLGEIGTTASGRFGFDIYIVDGKKIMVLVGQGRPR